MVHLPVYLFSKRPVSRIQRHTDQLWLSGIKKLPYIPEFNAEIVNRWENTGIITLGRTNTPEFGIKGITEPDAWGAVLTHGI